MYLFCAFISVLKLPSALTPRVRMEDLPEDAAPQPEAEPQKQPKPRPTSQKQEQPPMPCICARCNQPIKRVKLKDGSIMQAAEFAATHEGMCADCYKATRLNVA